MALKDLDYEKHVLPALAIVEAIASKGKSPGTTALTQQQMLGGMRKEKAQRERQALQDEASAKQQALQRQLGEMKLDEFEFSQREGEKKREAQAKKLEMQEAHRQEFLKRPDLTEEQKIQSEYDFPGLLKTIKLGEETKLAESRATDKAAQEAADRSYKRESELNARFEKESKTYKDVRDAYERVEASAEDPSAAGDLALIFNYMKILDPGSVVRESEFRTADQARAWLTRSEKGGFAIPAFVKRGIQKAETGQRLLPEQRTDFVDRGRRLFDRKQKDQVRIIDKFKGLASRYGVDEANVISPIYVPVRPFGNQKETPPPKTEVPTQQAAPALIPIGQIAKNETTGQQLRWNGTEWEKM